MNMFSEEAKLSIGTVFEVAGSSVKIVLNRNVTELTRSHGGRVYEIGQIGSLLKLHLGRRLLFVTVSMLRLQSDEETAATPKIGHGVSYDRRIIEADILGDGFWNESANSFKFKRGVSSYPLPLQSVYLVTQPEQTKLYEGVESERGSASAYAQIGHYVGASRVKCKANIDKMFGHHCAILGSTGSGKSSTVSAVLHAVLEHRVDKQTVKPHLVLLDPHGEYAAAFRGRADVYRAYASMVNEEDDDHTELKLPYWLMSSDEFRSLIIGKTEFEATSQANVVYKALTNARMVHAGLAQSAMPKMDDTVDGVRIPESMHHEDPIPCDGVSEEQILSFDRDRPLPFSLEEFKAHIVNRQAMKDATNKPVPPGEFQKTFAPILNKLRVLEGDIRIRFMMEEYTDEAPNLNSILRQFIAKNGEEYLKIVDISGLPSEVAGPLTGAIARLLFQYKLHQTRSERENDPVVLVCEEAHRYVPNRGEAQYAVAQAAIRRIAREGRKYGLGLMLVSQRPSDVEGTVISQCNTWVVLRLTNSNDQSHVAKFLPDNLSGMTALLSSMPRQEAIFVGEAAALPARIRLNTLTADQQPNSNDISFIKGWVSENEAGADNIANAVDRMLK